MYVSTRQNEDDNLQRKPLLQKIFQRNIYRPNDNDFTVQTVIRTCVQCVHHSDHDTLQLTFSLSDAVINEAPWQCAPTSTVSNFLPWWTPYCIAPNGVIHPI